MHSIEIYFVKNEHLKVHVRKTHYGKLKYELNSSTLNYASFPQG